MYNRNKNFISVYIYSVLYIHIVYIYTGYLRGKKITVFLNLNLWYLQLWVFNSVQKLLLCSIVHDAVLGTVLTSVLNLWTKMTEGSWTHVWISFSNIHNIFTLSSPISVSMRKGHLYHRLLRHSHTILTFFKVWYTSNTCIQITFDLLPLLDYVKEEGGGLNIYWHHDFTAIFYNNNFVITFLLNKKKRKVWLVIIPNRANDTKLNKFVGLTTHLSRANDNRK